MFSTGPVSFTRLYAVAKGETGVESSITDACWVQKGQGRTREKKKTNKRWNEGEKRAKDQKQKEDLCLVGWDC